MIYEDLTYVVIDKNKKIDNFKEFILKHSSIKFVSFFGIDFLGNDTDERIPIEYFLKNMESIFNGGIQTDGSSVNLPGIAELNDAKVEFIIDFKSKWIIDYNFDFLDNNNHPVGTIRIPVFFKHHNDFYCSRSVLKRSLDYVKSELMAIFQSNKNICEYYGVEFSKIKDIYFTLGTELEFWVRTPADVISVDELLVTQQLKESYWKRTKGQVRKAIEESLIMLQLYGLEPEMGHKEVGGVKGKISHDGSLHDVMEQLEIDWTYNLPLQTADNELLARIVIKEIFRKNGLEVTFFAKPVENVAGSGEHMHVGFGLELINGEKINLFASHKKNHYLAIFGYGALMGLLKNWEAINPLVTHSIDGLKRLKPGFESPICVVSSLGVSPENSSRNRSVLIGLVRSDNPLGVRFEVRAPNPHTNTYLSAAGFYLAMLDGVKYSLGKSEDELLKELDKDIGEDSEYLDKEREYRTEKNIFDDFNYDERVTHFGKQINSVWDILEQLKNNKQFYEGSPFSEKILNSYYSSVLNKWLIEIQEKILPETISKIREIKRFADRENSYDKEIWEKINKERIFIVKTNKAMPSLIQSIENAILSKKYQLVSKLFLALQNKMTKLEIEYKKYKKNLL
jgi:glutamine synthetase